MELRDNEIWNKELDENSVVGKLKCMVCDFTKEVTVKDMKHHTEHAFYDNNEAKLIDILTSISASIGRKCKPDKESITSATEADYHMLMFEKKETWRTFELAILLNEDIKNIKVQEEKIKEFESTLKNIETEQEIRIKELAINQAKMKKKISEKRITRNEPEFIKRAGNNRIDAWL